MRIKHFELFAVDLPFRKPVWHAAHTRACSSSVFLKCVLEDNTVGFGECLPREYVTGENQETVFHSLETVILPALIGFNAMNFEEVVEFLRWCDGAPPREWNKGEASLLAAWCAVDLALLDSFGRAFNESISFGKIREKRRYSAVLPLEGGRHFLKNLLLMRLLNFKDVKIKVGDERDLERLVIVRRILGKSCELRVDANMAWSVPQALRNIPLLHKFKIVAVEQPLPADNLEGAKILEEEGVTVVADESFSDRNSLERLIEYKACSVVNIRISKCGGLIASLARAKEALKAGIDVQLGCQVGESSLLSAANVILLHSIERLRFAEGCFGRYLLKDDPACPYLRFGYGGHPPALPEGLGLRVAIDEAVLRKHTMRHSVVTANSSLRESLEFL